MRSYDDPCGIARALDVLGERWALLIVRELVFGPKRFTDLKAGLRDASPNVLAQRLRELDASGVVQRASTGSASYELTDSGRALHPVLLGLGAWGARHTPRPKGPLSLDALLVALETTFAATRIGDYGARLGLVVDGQSFAIEIDAQGLAIARGAPLRADAILTTDRATLRACAFGDVSVATAVRSGKLVLAGDAKRARHFFTLFARPSPR